MPRWVVLVLVLAGGCATNDAPKPPGHPPRQLSLDLTVARQGVVLYTSFSDVDPATCFGGDAQFPLPGDTANQDDVVSCPSGATPSSCLAAVRLEVNGQAFTPSTMYPGRAIGIAADLSSATGAILDITGCNGSAQIPIGPANGPVPTITDAVADTTASTIRADWTAQPAAASAVFWFETGTWAEGIHATSSTVTFPVNDGTPVGAYRAAIMQAFFPPVSVHTDYGTVRIWTGESATANIQ